MRMLSEPLRSQIATTSSKQASHSASEPSSSMISAAPTSVGKPAPTAFSAAWIVRLSIISIAPGMTPPETISDTASPACDVVSKNATIVLIASGTGITRRVIARADAERALRADERPEQVIAGVVELLAAERDDLAVGEHDLQARDVVRREAVLEAVRAAGVLGDVAADRADDLRRRVGRVEVRRPDGGGDLDVRDAGLHDDALVGQVDLEQRAHPRQRDQDPVLDRQRAARQARSRAARDPRHARVGARAHDVADLGGARRQHDRAGRRLVLQQPVGLVRAQLVGVGVDVLVAADLAQARDERGRDRGVSGKRRRGDGRGSPTGS